MQRAPEKNLPITEVNGIKAGDKVVIISQGSSFNGRMGKVEAYTNECNAIIEVVGFDGALRKLIFTVNELQKAPSRAKGMSPDRSGQGHSANTEFPATWIRLLVWVSDVVLPAQGVLSLMRRFP